MKSGFYAVQPLQVYIPALYLIFPVPILDNYTRFPPVMLRSLSSSAAQSLNGME